VTQKLDFIKKTSNPTYPDKKQILILIKFNIELSPEKGYIEVGYLF
jgi:hypothetical protein